MKPWLLPASIAFLSWGVWAFLPKLTVRFIDPRSAIIFAALGGVLVAITALITLDFKIQTDPRGIGLAVLSGVLGVGGGLAYLFAMRQGPVTIIATVTALYPVLAILLAQFVLGEVVSLKQWLGVVLGLVAIALIAT
jgi:transporter family protein